MKPKETMSKVSSTTTWCSKMIFFLSFCLLSLATNAQTKSIKGVVTDVQGETLIGVSVIVKGSTTGTVTDFDGAYTISAKSGDVVVFSYLGMLSQSITLGNQNKLDVIMKGDANVLEEAVVIGYGSAKAKDLTSPIATIKTQDLERQLTASPMQGLQGKVSGIEITNTGQPGSSPKVRIRGVNNLDADKQGPLYVVDGMFFDDISFLSNNDIDNMSILKDASSAAIYGVRAANGVVIITTKKGIPNRKPQVVYDGNIGIQTVTNRLKMANSADYAMMGKEANNEKLLNAVASSIKRYGGVDGIPSVNTDWYDELTKTALMQSHSLSVTGGEAKTSYALGLNYLNQDGIMDVDNGYERVNTRAKVDTKVYNWLKLGANLVLSQSTQKMNTAGGAWQAAYHNPSIYLAHDSKTTYTKNNPELFTDPALIGLPNYFWNPKAIAYYNQNEQNKKTQILPSFYAEASFLDDKLTLKSAYSQELSFTRYRKFIPLYEVSSVQKTGASYLQKKSEFYNNWIWDNTITYRDAVDKHNYTVLAGQSVRSERFELLRIEADDVPGDKEEYMYVHHGVQRKLANNAGDDNTWPDNGKEYRGLSFFGRVMYDYAGKYLLSATFRADGSSKYQEKWGYFPSLGAGWVLSQEDFMKDQTIFNFLKLRANWGKLGNDKIAASDGFASVSPGTGIFNDQTLAGSNYYSLYSTLKWEKVEETDLGISFTMFNNRLTGEFDYYYRTTLDAVFSKPLPFGGGNLAVNNGKINNRGVELTLNWNDKLTQDLNYNIGFNITTLKNEVKDLDGLQRFVNGNTIRQLGEAADSFYGYKVAGVYQNMAEVKADPIAVANKLKPGDFKYVDMDNDDKLTPNDAVVLGSPIPKLFIGGNLGFDYKNVDFNLAFSGKFGHKIANIKRQGRNYQDAVNFDKEWVDSRWTGEGTSNKYPSAAGAFNPWNVGKFSSFYVENASTFTIQNIQLGYTFKDLFKSGDNKSSLRLSFTAERPFSFFSYNGFTTDIEKGLDTNTYPLASVYSFGVKFIY
ncbi:MAG: hypothetical protein RL662_686 [Bacteroidota bacterium]|jgi:TonB-linked SusC/RagA family outer membrane protein